jgi:REP element-mobilizing transposase RayT
MPSTYSSLHYHLVFSTKDRLALISPDWRDRLHEYLGGIVRGLGGVPSAVGGVADHVHLLVGLKPTHCLADFMRDLKKDATNWVNEQLLPGTFAWQEGYAAFTVGPTSIEAVRHYIRNQEAHHAKRDFRAELVAMLGRAKIEFDERYLD